MLTAREFAALLMSQGPDLPVYFVVRDADDRETALADGDVTKAEVEMDVKGGYQTSEGDREVVRGRLYLGRG